MNCTLMFWLGVSEGLVVGMVSSIYAMHGLQQARHLHLGKLQVHGNNHDGDILSRVLIFSFQLFMSVRHRVVAWAKRVSASVCTALQHLLILRL